jgi:hypothetical protein
MARANVSCVAGKYVERATYYLCPAIVIRQAARVDLLITQSRSSSVNLWTSSHACHALKSFILLLMGSSGLLHITSLSVSQNLLL